VRARAHSLRTGRLATGLCLLALLLLGGVAQAERSEELPAELEGLGIFERPGAELPLALEFTDSRGRAVKLADYFEGGRPVIVNLVYYDCPMLCNLLLDGFVKGLRELEWTAGQEFEIVTVSIDPGEKPEQARFKKAYQVESYGRPSAAEGWHFLTGEDENIRVLADAVGFRFAYDEERDEYRHAAGLFVATPDGVLSRTLYGLAYDEQTLRLSLVEASAGEIGSAIDHALLFCFYYDAESGRYAPAAMNLMRLGGGTMAFVLALWLITFWLRDRRRRVALEGSLP